MSHKPLLIMAGGTGGHVYPALAVADSVLWLGTRTGLEYRVVPGNGYRLLTIDVKGIRGKSVDKWLIAPFQLIRAVIQAMLILVRNKPAAALGMGGFASAPGGIAAWLLRIPLLIHEQNSIAGTTNRLLKPLAKVIMEGFPGTFKADNKVYTTGNPVRMEIIKLPGPENKFESFHGRNFHLLILGGSLGAKTLNETAPAALALIAETLDIQVWHQTGELHYVEVKKLYEHQGVSAKVRLDAFIEDMAEAYTWADLVLCRAGALTIAELCVAGIASILVPYPYAIDDHQTANARYLSSKGCALLIPESELDINKLAKLISDIAGTPKRLFEMSDLTRQQARPQATRDVAELCLGFIHA
jgi:UDP-N-acetylglucosamine--N-acetylmuramyl-(pentapeptide) pyrophosphoryl-undecaprenol N-acetylglucosamine transferase